jgi:hypothetical protein
MAQIEWVQSKGNPNKFRADCNGFSLRVSDDSDTGTGFDWSVSKNERGSGPVGGLTLPELFTLIDDPTKCRAGVSKTQDAAKLAAEAAFADLTK